MIRFNKFVIDFFFYKKDFWWYFVNNWRIDKNLWSTYLATPFFTIYFKN